MVITIYDCRYILNYSDHVKVCQILSHFINVNQYFFVIKLLFHYCQVKYLQHQGKNIGLDGYIVSGKYGAGKWF